jgi:hypothetical protein
MSTTHPQTPAHLCRGCAHLFFTAGRSGCSLSPAIAATPATLACGNYDPTWYPLHARCTECRHLQARGLRLSCGAYPGPDPPPLVHPCPSFAPRSPNAKPERTPTHEIDGPIR